MATNARVRLDRAKVLPDCLGHSITMPGRPCISDKDLSTESAGPLDGVQNGNSCLAAEIHRDR